MHSHRLDLPVLVVRSVVIPCTDLCSWLGRSFHYVEHFVVVSIVVYRLTLLIVMPLLVLLSRLLVVDHQPVGTFHNQSIQLTKKKLHDSFASLYMRHVFHRLAAIWAQVTVKLQEVTP